MTVREVARPSPAPSPLPARQIPKNTDILPHQPQPVLPDAPASAPLFPSHYSEVTERIKQSLAKLHDKDVVQRPEDTAESGLPPMLRPRPNVNQVKQRQNGTRFAIPAAQVGSPSTIHLPMSPFQRLPDYTHLRVWGMTLNLAFGPEPRVVSYKLAKVREDSSRA